MSLLRSTGDALRVRSLKHDNVVHADAEVPAPKVDNLNSFHKAPLTQETTCCATGGQTALPSRWIASERFAGSQ